MVAEGGAGARDCGGGEKDDGEACERRIGLGRIFKSRFRVGVMRDAQEDEARSAKVRRGSTVRQGRTTPLDWARCSCFCSPIAVATSAKRRPGRVGRRACQLWLRARAFAWSSSVARLVAKRQSAV